LVDQFAAICDQPTKAAKSLAQSADAETVGEFKLTVLQGASAFQANYPRTMGIVHAKNGIVVIGEDFRIVLKWRDNPVAGVNTVADQQGSLARGHYLSEFLSQILWIATIERMGGFACHSYGVPRREVRLGIDEYDVVPFGQPLQQNGTPQVTGCKIGTGFGVEIKISLLLHRQHRRVIAKAHARGGRS